jgi:hypothetical protein
MIQTMNCMFGPTTSNEVWHHLLSLIAEHCRGLITFTVEGLDWDTAPGDHDDDDDYQPLDVAGFSARLTKLVLTYKALCDLNIDGSDVEIMNEAWEELERREEVNEQSLRRIIV